MFSANPAKRPRRETMTDALNVASQKIADALKPGKATNEPAVAVEQVSRLYYSWPFDTRMRFIAIAIPNTAFFSI